MRHRALIAYASRAGSTAEVAQSIGDVLRQRGLDVGICSVRNIDDISGYDAFVLGTAIWAGKPLPEMRKFVTIHQDALAQRPVAYFIQCDLLREYSPGNRQIALGYLTPLRRMKEPVSIGLFAGRRDFSKTNPILRWFLMRVVRLAEGDWRNWEQIREWAASIVPRLDGTEAVPVGSGIVGTG
jgi:menaquinone-dependent protoporphyrinogen oxidase